MGEYIPQAPMNDEARKYNGNLPGMGGIFNTVNLHVYHYAGNNPVRYTDPDGRAVPAIVVKLLADAGIGAVKGACTAVAMKYLTTSIIRFMKGESFVFAFTPQKQDFAGYGKAILKGAGEGAFAGLLSNIPFLDETARSGRIGSGLATAATSMLTTTISTIVENLIEGRDITDGLGRSVTLAGVIGFAVGIASQRGMSTGNITGFNPITGKPYLSDEDVIMFAEEALRAELFEILGKGFEELLNEMLE
jgi:hypothetical protein